MRRNMTPFLLLALPLAVACTSFDGPPSECFAPGCEEYTTFPAPQDHPDGRSLPVIADGEAVYELPTGVDAGLHIALHDDGTYEAAYTECVADACDVEVVVGGDWILDHETLDIEGIGLGRLTRERGQQVVIVDLDADVAPSELRGQAMMLIVRGSSLAL